MILVRVCVIAGLVGIAATMPANASTQDCSGWLKWTCSNAASSNPVREVASRERKRARTPAASSSQMNPITQQVRGAPGSATRQQTKRWEATHPITAARNTRSSDPSGDQRPVVINDREKEALFQEFSAWQKARRSDTDANSDRSGDQRSVVMNDQEKDALFQEFLAWQKARRLNADANQ